MFHGNWMSQLVSRIDRRWWRCPYPVPDSNLCILHANNLACPGARQAVVPCLSAFHAGPKRASCKI